MAMDILGLNPISETGEYFRASVWAWHPLVYVMQTTCSDFMPDIFFDKIRCNLGTRVTEKQSLLIANRLIQYSEHYVNGVTICPHEVSPVATAVIGILEKNKAINTTPELHISDDRLQDWIEFLQNCGGFTVQ